MSPTHQQQQQYYQPQTFQQPISLSADQILTISFHFQRPPLGKGGFSTVYEGEFCGFPVAVKILTVRNQNERALFEIELAVLCNERLRHRNLLPLIGFCHERPALVMPRLKPLNKDRLPRLPGSVRMLVAMDVARGLAHLHQAGFVHNDMKPDNVLLEFDENRNIVRALVGDLGCAKVTSIPVQPFGTMLFMDPQLSPHGPPVLPKTADDVYSFALTVVCIFTNSFPENQDDLARMWATIEATFPLVANLARRMTQPDWRLRPSCAQAEVELKQIDEGWRVAIELQKAAAAGAAPTIQSPPRSQSALQQHTQPQQQLQPQHHSSALLEHRDRKTVCIA
ncbi:protein kinase, putative [Bodo saltans]|uniref:Protein kinase, putative n=1 Tax=Bodo saltans TaxID=75058 RepID=A0A0S4IR96_BODSA|nr:protein kinase, putative [Bodo saltans]|eukprot:CUF42134.1 protein kinase, putative [Bodo saltans]